MRQDSCQDINRYRVSFLSPDTKYMIRRLVLSPSVQTVSWLCYFFEPIVPREWLALDRPVFVIGCSRSGTTLFVDMLARHEDLANWSEAAQIFELRYCNPNIDHAKSRKEASPSESRRLKLLFGAYVRLRGKSRFLNKHPQNSMRIPYLKTIFPGAQFIHVIRDARATILSNIAQIQRDRYRQSIPFGSFPKPLRWRDYLALGPIERFAHQWVDIIVTIREHASRLLGSEDYLEVRYEEFCRDPHGSLARIDDFCGLDFKKRDYASIPARFTARDRWWEQKFSRDDLASIEEIAGSLMRALGYLE